MRWTAFTLLGLTAVISLTGSVAAKQPQTPEEIVFKNIAPTQVNELYLIGRDGSNLRRLTFDGAAMGYVTYARWIEDRLRIGSRRRSTSGSSTGTAPG